MKTERKSAMRVALTVLCCLLALPALAQRPSGAGVLSGMFSTGVTPQDRQVAEPARIFYQVRIGGKPWRYPAQVTRDTPAHFHRFICKAKSIPTDVLLTDIRLVIVEPKGKETFCLPSNFDGRAVLLSSKKAVVSINGWKCRASKPGRISANDARIECPSGLGSLSGLKFLWAAQK